MIKRWLYLSPFGYVISIILNAVGFVFRPFMVYGFFDPKTFTLKRSTRIGSSVVFLDKKNLTIGDNCWIGHHSIIDSSNGVRIGDGVQLAGFNGIYSHSSHNSIRYCGSDFINVAHTERYGYVRGSVEIGDYSFIGAGAIILPGVNIGKGCVIGAGSIVNISIPDFSIAVGVPVRITGSVLDADARHFSNDYVKAHYFDKSAICQK